MRGQSLKFEKYTRQDGILRHVTLLRYAAKARKIRNKPVQNRNKMGALRQEVEMLRKQNQEYQVWPCPLIFTGAFPSFLYEPSRLFSMRLPFLFP